MYQPQELQPVFFIVFCYAAGATTHRFSRKISQPCFLIIPITFLQINVLACEQFFPLTDRMQCICDLCSEQHEGKKNFQVGRRRIMACYDRIFLPFFFLVIVIAPLCTQLKKYTQSSIQTALCSVDNGTIKVAQFQKCFLQHFRDCKTLQHSVYYFV